MSTAARDHLEMIRADRDTHCCSGKVLVVRVVSEVVRTSGVHLVVADCDGRVAPVQVCNVQPKRTTNDLNAIYRLGSYWGKHA